jgi:hypothetical protein
MSLAWRPESERACLVGATVRSTRSWVSSVSLARESVVSRCLGPSASAVMNGRLMLVDWVVESSILAFSAA